MPAAESTPGGEWFVDLAAQAGLDFVHVNGSSGRFYYPEIFGPGVALFDYDGDGDLDVYVSQGGQFGGAGSARAAAGAAAAAAPVDRLYRNELASDGNGDRTLRFTDVTAASGLTPHGYGMGAAAGDIDNDGCVDLFLTRVDASQLFRNNCDGTFSDITSRSGTAASGWAVSASFLDYDRDGWLDLWVGLYVHYAIDTHVDCFSMSGRPNYCTPDAFRARPGHLFRNRRNGTFADVTAAALTPLAFGPALGSATADFDGDGWLDIYVANDGAANQLWRNHADGTFRDTALLSGTALNGDGRAEASMGVDAGDYDADGDEDLVIANLTGEGTTVYRNDGHGTFDDVGARSGVRGQTLRFTGFGTSWMDFDNDGWLDILTVNGAVRLVDGATPGTGPPRLDQPKQLLRNLGDGRFTDVTARAGAAFAAAEVGRGAAFGDIDNDGDVDVVVGSNGGPLRLLINRIGNRQRWLGLRLVGSRRDMLGARVAIVRAGQPTLWRRARADGSYGSASDPRVLVGLGTSADPPTVRVVWPSGRTEEWVAPGVDRWLALTEGSGS